ncbi:hypothetical protein F4777DRAFT_554945 [Nemania sp. FL0916]|nr:hypothetical protein F4777DRAFT_554945 [Nemania sp. FL0916]
MSKMSRIVPRLERQVVASSSVFTCAQCTRRLSHLARSRSQPQLCRPSSQDGPLFPGTQGVSSLRTRKSTPPRTAHGLYFYGTAPGEGGRKPSPLRNTRDAFNEARFSRDAVPPKEFWLSKSAFQNGLDLPIYPAPEELMDSLAAYVEAAKEDKAGWRRRLIVLDHVDGSGSGSGPDAPSSDRKVGSRDGDKRQGKTISAWALHYVALAPWFEPMIFSRSLSVHILNSLAGLGYVPSILTLTRQVLAKNGRKIFEFNPIQPTLEALYALANRIGDGSSKKKTVSENSYGGLAPDICTLRAMLYAAEGTQEGDTTALRWFRRAREMAPEKSRLEFDKNQLPGRPNFCWQWRDEAALGVAAIRMKRGELDKAEAMYKAAAKYGRTEGWLGLADVLEKTGRGDSRLYYDAIQAAAMSGDKHALRRMGLYEWARVAEEGLSEKEKRARAIVAEEWMVAAGVTKPTE